MSREGAHGDCGCCGSPSDEQIEEVLGELLQDFLFGVDADGGSYAYRRGRIVADEEGLGALARLGVLEERSVDEPDAASLAELGVFVASLRDHVDPLAAAAAVRLNPELGGQAEPDYAVHPLYHFHYFPDTLPVPTSSIAPPSRGGGSAAVVGVVDTGVWVDHPWWAGTIDVQPLDATRDREVPPTSTGALDAGHGTFVAGVIRQVAPSVGVRVRGLGVGKTLTDAAVAAAMLDLAKREVRIVNVSLGTCTAWQSAPVATGAAVRSLRNRGVVVVAAAGNYASAQPVYPAAFDGVVSVGAAERTTSGPARAPYSSFGSWVNAFAPGDHASAFFDDWVVPLRRSFRGYARWKGTSFSSAVVAARLAEQLAATGATDVSSLGSGAVDGCPFVS